MIYEYNNKNAIRRANTEYIHKEESHSIKNKVVQLGLLVKLTKCTQAN
jgi:hypothetical protein